MMCKRCEALQPGDVLADGENPKVATVLFMANVIEVWPMTPLGEKLDDDEASTGHGIGFSTLGVRVGHPGYPFNAVLEAVKFVAHMLRDGKGDWLSPYSVEAECSNEGCDAVFEFYVGCDDLDSRDTFRWKVKRIVLS